MLHFFVRGLGKIDVVLADAEEFRRILQAKDVIGSVLQLLTGNRRADRDRNNDFGGALLTQRSYRGPHARARGKPIVDQDNGTMFKFRRRTISSIISFAPLQFLTFNRGHLVDDILRIRHDAKHVFVQNTDAAGSDRAHSEFLVAGHAEFAHNKNVERNTEPLRDFEGDRYTTTRKTENNYIVASGVAQQLFRKLPSRIGPVLENLEWRHGRSTNQLSGASSGVPVTRVGTRRMAVPTVCSEGASPAS